MDAHGDYYIPDPSPWPLTASLAIFTMFVGGALTLNGTGSIGPGVLAVGFLGS